MKKDYVFVRKKLVDNNSKCEPCLTMTELQEESIAAA